MGHFSGPVGLTRFYTKHSRLGLLVGTTKNDNHRQRAVLQEYYSSCSQIPTHFQVRISKLTTPQDHPWTNTPCIEFSNGKEGGTREEVEASKIL